MKTINEVGKKYGRLTVLSRQGSNSANRALWLCQCDCGKQIVVIGKNLRSGNTCSCGCLQKEKLSARVLKDITGETFGKLTVLQRDFSKTGPDAYWLCQCECGNQTIVAGTSLRKGHTQSCGCMKSKGEEKIIKLLKENQIPFETQKIFEDCRFVDTNSPARFDFWVNNKYLIEYDGEQHFQSKNSGWDTNEYCQKTQEHDAIKNQYCLDFDIPLIRIPYTQYNNLSIKDLKLETTNFLFKREKGGQ